MGVTMTAGSIRVATTAKGGLSMPLRACVALGALLFACWCALLWPQWVGEPDLTHGLFIPVVVAALFYESRRSGSGKYLPDTRWVDAAELVLALLGLAALTAGGLYAAAMGWDHAVADLFLSAGMAALLLTTLMALSRSDTRYLPFGWPCLAAPLLCLLCSPIPPGTSARLTGLLQAWVTESVLRILNFTGVPAFRTGNIIELAHARLGVDEACSGLRSLVSCVFAGVFISAAWLYRPWTRWFVVLLAAPLAIGMNLLRSLALAFVAERGLRINGLLHDIAGWAILLATSLILALLAFWLGHDEPSGERDPPTEVGGRPRRSPAWIALAALSLAAAWVAAWYFKPLGERIPSAELPDLAALVPARMPGWEVSTHSDLQQFEPVLHTRCLLERTYARLTPSGRQEVSVYVAFWLPGQASVTSVSSHTPDMCLPGSGWVAVPAARASPRLAVHGVTIPLAQTRIFVLSGNRLNIWFWHLYGGELVEDLDMHSPLQLISEGFRNGVRANRSQVFLRISSNAPWSELADGTLLPELFVRLGRLGL